MFMKQRLGRQRMLPALLAVMVIGGLLMPVAAQDSSTYEEISGMVLDAAERLMPFSPDALLPVYQIADMERTTLALMLEADEFGLMNLVEGEWGDEAAFLEDREEYWLIRGEEVKATAFYASSFMSVVNTERAYLGECWIDESAAISIAFDYVDQIGARDGNAEFEVYEVVSFWSQATSLEGETSDSVLSTLAVVFNKRLKDVPVIGPGGKVVFLITGDGEIIGIHRNLRFIDPDPIDEVPLIALDGFADAFVRSLQTRFGDEPPFTIEDFTIEKFEVGLFSDAKRHSQRFLQPTYALMYVIENEDFVYASSFILPALDEPYGPAAGAAAAPEEVEEVTTPEEEDGEKE